MGSYRERAIGMRCKKMPGQVLTLRQIEVVQLTADGLSARQSAQRLGLSVRTVEAYLAAARKRTGAASTAELIAKMTAAGILTLQVTMRAPEWSQNPSQGP